jgi:hypothetical protein
MNTVCGRGRSASLASLRHRSRGVLRRRGEEGRRLCEREGLPIVIGRGLAALHARRRSYLESARRESKWQWRRLCNCPRGAQWRRWRRGLGKLECGCHLAPGQLAPGRPPQALHHEARFGCYNRHRQCGGPCDPGVQCALLAGARARETRVRLYTCHSVTDEASRLLDAADRPYVSNVVPVSRFNSTSDSHFIARLEIPYR